MKTRGFALVFSLTILPLAAPGLVAQDSPGGTGLGTYLHPLNLPGPSLEERARAIPEAQRDLVHFFVVNGFDPGYLGNLNGLAEYVQSLGFRNTRLYYLYQNSRAGDDIRAVRQQNPHAKVILLGYSWGANAVRIIANQLNDENIPLDSLIYLGGDTIMNEPRSSPGNIRNILNVTGNGLIFLGYNIYYKGDDLAGADNRRLAVRHMLLPSRRETIEWISGEVIRVAQEGSQPKQESRLASPTAPMLIPVLTPIVPIQRPRQFQPFPTPPPIVVPVPVSN